MKRGLYLVLLLITIPFAQTMASHAVGADLTYDCLGGNTYRFRLKFYRDCAGIAAPTSVSINIVSTSCARSTSITMPLISSQEVSPLCAAQLPNSTCNGGTLPGIQQYIYEATYTLPANCTDWRFSYTLCCRNVAVTNSNNASSYNLYVEANLNNVAVTCNSSPDFTVNPVPYICNGQPFSYNHGVVDVDGDSLSYTLIQPKHTATANVPYSGSFSPTYPISTSPANNFVFNPSTGQMTFTPGGTQIGLVAIRVDEFRNGVKIGSTIRDMQVIVINCGTNSTPAMGAPNTITGASYNTTTSTFKACPNIPMSFQIVSTDLDAIQLLTLTSNVLTSIPGATVSSVGTNPVTTTFQWTPTPANAGFYSISFRAVDNACPLTASVTRGFNIYVPSLNGSISDTMVCPGTGKAFNLNATPTGTDGTETYLWTPNVGFTTSNAIRNPSVNVSTPQTYVVSMTQGSCVLTDTVKVKPYASLVASPDSSLCPFDPAIQLTSTFTKLMPSLSASAVTYSWTPTSGLTPSATISNPSAKPVSTTAYILSAGDALCTMKDTVRISVVPCPCFDTARIASPKVLTCMQLLDTLDGSASSAGSSFQWFAYAGGNIVSGSTTANPIINQPGLYTLVITNTSNGCVDSTSITVVRNVTLPNINAGLDTALNCVRSSLSLTATSSTTGAIYLWSTSANTATINVTTPNTYSITATNPINGCTASDGVVVSQNLTAPIANAGVDTILYCNRTTINWFATSNVAGATYTWSNGVNTVANSTTVPNTYTVTVTNPLNGCTASDAMVISQNITAPIANAGVDTILYCNRTTINWSATSNVAGATYTWSNGVNTAANSTTVPNTYTVTVTNPLNGCTSSDAMVISQNLTAPIANAGVDTILYCNRTTINWFATSNIAVATYVWSNGVNTAANSTTVPNTYTVTVTNPLNGCTASDAMVISQNITAPVANAGVDTILYCNRTTINWFATSNVAGATYIWSNGLNTAANSTSVPNTYTVTVTNPLNGCTASDAMVISLNLTAPVANAGVDTILYCNRTTINWSATSNVAGATYTWSNGVNTAANSTTVPNTYTVTVTNPLNGCTASDAMVISQNITAPIANAGVDTILYCNRTTINWSATSNIAGATYAWSNGVNTAANTTTVPNTYTVTVTNPLNGCTTSDAMVISQNITAPTANAGVDTILYCNRTTINWTATSNVASATYTWSNGVNTAANSSTVPNTYTVTVTNPLNGCTSSDAMIISQNLTLPVVNAGVDTILNCTRTSLTLHASAIPTGASFVWSNGANSASTSVSFPSAYTVTATHPVNGCTANDVVVVTQDVNMPIANAGVDTILYCNRTSINWTATANVTGATYTWSNGVNTAANTATVPNTYTVTVTDPSNGCSSIDAMVISQNITAPIANAGVDTILYCNRTTINWTATSNVTGATYAWSNGVNNALNSATVPNTYTVTVTNPLNGCTASDAMVISQDLSLPNINAGIDTVLNCVRTNLNLNATSSISGATFVWSNGPSTAISNIILPSTYTVTATHPVNGCTASDAVVVGIDTVKPNADAGIDTVINCTYPIINLLGSSSNNGVSVIWAGPGIVSGGTSFTPSINDAGGYSMTITNIVSGCFTTDQVLVFSNFVFPNADAGILDSITCAKPQITLQGSSITPNVSYSWAGPGILSGGNTNTPMVNIAGLYTLTVTSLVNGCIKTDTVRVVQETTAPQVSAGIDTTLTCIRTNLDLIATSSTPSPVTFDWSNGANTAITNVSFANSYTVTATNTINGCTASDVVVILMDTIAPGVNAGIDTVLNCVRTNINLNASSSTLGATFVWSTGATIAYTSITTTNTYTVTATHPVNGCTASDAVVVGIDTVKPNADAGIDSVINCTNPTISLLGSSNTYGVTVSWAGPGIMSGPTTFSPVVNDAGLYTMTITNIVSGCVTPDEVIISANFIVPNAEAGNLDSVTCKDVQINLQGSSITSNVSYSWSGPGIASGANTSTPLVNASGLYTLMVTSLTNGCSKTDTVSVIQEITTPQVSAGADTSLTCVRTNLNLTATSSTPAPISFAWSNGTNSAITNVSTSNIYTVTVTNLINGCTVSDAVAVSMDTVAPVLNAGIDTVLNCFHRNLSLQVSSNIAGAVYQWSNGVTGIVNPITIPNIYRVTATHPSNGCVSMDAVIVVIDTTTPDINAGLDTTLKCYRRSVVLNATSLVPNMNYVWSNGTVGAANTVSAANMYTVIGQNPENGCVNSDAVIVNIDTVAPNANAGPDKIVNCIKASDTLNASSSTPNVTYLWSNGTSTSANTVSTTIAYTVTVTNPFNGCTASDIAVLIPDTVAPGANAGADKDLTCTITSVSFTALSPTANVTYQWSTGITGQNITVSVPNTYVVTVTSLSNGCTSTDAVNANLVPPPTVTYDVLDNPCPQVAKGYIVPIISGGIAPFTFTWNNGSNASALVGLHGGGYAVTITDANGCVITDTFNLLEKQFILDVTADQTEIELGEEVHFNSNITVGTGMETLTWSPGIFLSCDDCKNPTAGPMKSVKYNIVAVDTNGCSSTDTISIQVTPKYDLFVPNAFSPNSDGSNDVYEIFGNKKIWAEVEFKIFNRWGELIFESRDHEFKWDGTFKGEMLPPQVVVYEFKVVYVDGYSAPTQKGSITLIR